MRRTSKASSSDLEAARAAIQLPALRKDFTIAPSQIVEAAAHGADAILLIAAILANANCAIFANSPRGITWPPWSSPQPRRTRYAIASGAGLIGVNNRDLTSSKSRSKLRCGSRSTCPSGALLVSESGIHDARDIAQLRAAGFHAFLVGEHLMKSGDPAGALRKLVAA